MKLTTHLSTPWGWKAELADQQTVYPYKWLAISCRYGADSGSSPVRDHWATKPTGQCNNATDQQLTPLKDSQGHKHLQSSYPKCVINWQADSVITECRVLPARATICVQLWGRAGGHPLRQWGSWHITPGKFYMPNRAFCGIFVR